MRKLICILCCCLLLAVLTPDASAAGITAAVSTEAVTLNGAAIDNRQAKYPLLVYRDITYFPMTYYLCSFLGVSSRWDGSTLYIDRTGASAAYTAETSSTQKRGNVSVSRVTYPVVINGTEFDSKTAKWPLLSYNNVTYFPLTWALAVEELGWDYQWTAANGLQISSDGSGIAESPDRGGSGGGDPDPGDAQAMQGIGRGFYPTVWGISPEKLSVDLTDWTLQGIRNAVRQELAAYVKDTGYLDDLNGPSEINISYRFQVPEGTLSGMVLEVPFTAVFQGQTVTLPSGNTYTPTGSTQELTASVRLIGEGNFAVDSEFQAGQAMYNRLRKCTEAGTFSVSANTTFDPAGMIRASIDAKLSAAGLSEVYAIQSMSLGTHNTVLSSGGSMTVDCDVTFTPLTAAAPTQAVTIPFQAAFQAK